MADAVVNIHEAKTHLSRLLRRVEAGEVILIARAGEPVARLSRADATDADEPPRPLGTWRGRVTIADDFDAPLPGLADAFEAGPVDPTDG